MLHLDSHITITEKIYKSANICDQFSELDLDRIGLEVWEGYNLDKSTRTLWETRSEAAMNLAMQMQVDKNFPWPNCSNVAFPLITVAVQQFHARAYPALINGADIVKCRVLGADPDGKKLERANRVSTHMSYQVMEEDVSWEEQHDRLLINIAVVGCGFIKTYRNSKRHRNTSEFVSAKDLVVNYWAKSIEDCDRKTHVYPLTRNDIYERVRREIFRDVLEETWYVGDVKPQQDLQESQADRRSGRTPPQPDKTTTFKALEQHCSLDLDGDGYAEPYVITIEESSRKVLRIVTRFDRKEDIERVTEGPNRGKIISINPMEYFTKYSFIPSPDGGIYDIGFGVLTGPLNESVNSLVNQLIDAGTMANSGGGFLGRGAKIRGGAYTFAPFEWKRVDSTGDDLHKSIVPLTVREPSAVLLNLLSLLINYTQRISGSTDMLAGENPGQNTPAETTRSMIEQGAKIYSAIFKRLWRGMREEFKKLYTLNSIFMPQKTYFGAASGFALREDYLGDPAAIVPVADPRITNQQERLMQAQALKQAAMTTPGYDVVEVERRYLKALHIDAVEQVYPGPKKFPPPQDPKMAIEQIKLEAKKLALKAQMMSFVMELEETKRVNDAQIMQLHAQTAKLMAEAGGTQHATEIAAFEAAVGAIKVHNDQLNAQKKLMLEGMQDESDEQAPNGGGMAGLAPASGNPSTEEFALPMEGGLEGPT